MDTGGDGDSRPSQEPTGFEFPTNPEEAGIETGTGDRGEGAGSQAPPKPPNAVTDGDDGEDDDEAEWVDVSTNALELKYEEAKRVHEYQLESIRDIDDKAAHTLRILVVLLGLLVTAVSIAARALVNEPGMGIGDLAGFLNVFTMGGLLALFCSLFAAIWTYNETSPIPGFGPRQLWARRAATLSKRELLQDLNDNFPRWIMHNEVKARKDATWLFVSHVLMFVALLALVTGVGLEVATVVRQNATDVPVAVEGPSIMIALGSLLAARGLWMVVRPHVRGRFARVFGSAVGSWLAWVVGGLLLALVGLYLGYPSAFGGLSGSLGTVVSKVFIPGGPYW